MHKTPLFAEWRLAILMLVTGLPAYLGRWLYPPYLLQNFPAGFPFI
jgi:hypothetical protein